MWMFLMACTASSPEVGKAVGGVEDVPGLDVDDAQFDPTVLHELNVTVADWDSLLVQRRSYYDLLSEGCMSQPWPSPYTWFEAKATFDGEDLGTVGIRKKGLIGSDSLTRPSLKIDTDHFVPGQHFHGAEKLVFNNNNQDPGAVRSCLAHEVFADAGIVAARCSLTHVVVNGQDLGIYSHVESIDPDLVDRVEGDKPLSMYEGTLSDFREGWLPTFEFETPESDGSDLQAVTDALDGDDAGLLARLDPIVDLDAFYRFWAAESLTGHWDGYNGNTNNFFVYRSAENGKLRFIASGPDAAFDSRQPFGADQPIWVATASVLANRLIQTSDGKKRYEEELSRQLDEVWDSSARLAQLSHWKDLLDPYQDRNATAGLQQTWTVVSNREADFRSTMGGQVEPPALRGNPCWVDHGVVRVDFQTTPDSYPNGDLFGGGTSVASYVIDGTEYPSIADGVSIGDSGDGRLLWLQIHTLAADTFLASYVQFSPDLLVANADLPLDGHAAEAALLYNDPTTGGNWNTVAYLALGSLHFDRTDTVVSGWLEGTVMGGE